MAHSTTCTCTDCCEGLKALTPVPINNRAGLKAIAYRVGTHPQFKQTLVNQLATAGPANQRLTVRQDSDFSVALLDAWATIADVLTFYQERIANESYLRTATERLSVQELARLIGYQLQPGVAASTYLAFTVEQPANATLAPNAFNGGEDDKAAIRILPGTKVQSVPEPGEEAHTFETIEAVEARPEWNILKPRLTKPQTLALNMAELWLKGIQYNLKPGDVLLICTGATKQLRKIQTVRLNETAKTTHLSLVKVGSSEMPMPAPPPPLSPGKVDNLFRPMALDLANINTVRRNSWQASDLSTLIVSRNWRFSTMVASFDQPLPPPPPPPQPSPQPPTELTLEKGAFVFRKKAFFFGYNAPKKIIYTNGQPTNEQEYPLLEDEKIVANELSRFYLDTTYDDLMPGGVIAIQKPGESLENVGALLEIQDVTSTARTAYGLSGKTTALTVKGSWYSRVSSPADLAGLRNLTIHIQNEPLALAEEPDTSNIEGNRIVLDQPYFFIQPGQKLMLVGREVAIPQVSGELITVKNAFIVGNTTELERNTTELELERPLTRAYVRDTVTLNGNVALATEGQTVQETLGRGDARQVFQQFTLRQPPLTYVAGANARGAVSTLEIRINGQRWHEVPHLLDSGPQDHVYIIRQNDAGQTTVGFGDGITGARLPTGSENIRATYRWGMGLGGLVKANQLSQLVSRPGGIKSVNNPLRATGADDPEPLENARQNAPIPILTLGRIVSRQDYADFARAFAGVAKTLATQIWFGQFPGILITVAGANGATIEPDSFLFQKLLDALRQASDPNVPFRVQSYTPVYFQLRAGLKIAADFDPEPVQMAVEKALRTHFSFASREFGQAVTRSEVIATIQQVKGVVGVDLDAFFRTEQSDTAVATELPTMLTASLPLPGTTANTIHSAELLILDPRRVVFTLLP